MSRFGYTSLGFGSGGTSTSPPGFQITIFDTRANIEARSGDAAGVIAFVNSGVNEFDLMVYDGTEWQIYENS